MIRQEPARENAMTEIALALAMGFFSLMVLTLISMGVGDGKAGRTQILALAPTATPKSGAGTAEPTDNDLIIIFDGKAFLDTSLQPVDPQAAIRAMAVPARRVVLALPPSLPLKDAMAARARVTAENLVVSSLDDRWLAALAARNGGRK